MRPSQPAPVENVLAPKLSEHAFTRVLLLPPEGAVEVKDVSVAVVTEKQIPYYTNKVEKLLLAKGFEVISPEIVARADAETQGQKLSAAEKALILGQKTKADAVFMLQSVAVYGGSKYYQVDEHQTAEVEPGRVRKEEGEDHPVRTDTEKCLHELPYYELRLEAKMIDAQSGSVLWVGTGRQTTIDAFKDSYIADVDDDCDVLGQSFIYDDYLRDEATLDRTVAALLDRVISPMAKAALAGKAVVDEPEKKAAPPPVVVAPAPPPPPPAVKTAVVSARGTLREGPSKKDARIKDVPRKAKVEVVETMGEWIKVKIQDGTVGWMHESTLIVND
ncbi:MAG TPA: SH3 domain-containing protein [Polyangiales bacterium]|nr:SH3 domain-containing protein [Polyangiales bacterium]